MEHFVRRSFKKTLSNCLKTTSPTDVKFNFESVSLLNLKVKEYYFFIPFFDGFATGFAAFAFLAIEIHRPSIQFKV